MSIKKNKRQDKKLRLLEKVIVIIFRFVHLDT